MQLLEHYDPLNLPRGSVRALVTLALFDDPGRQADTWGRLKNQHAPWAVDLLKLLNHGTHHGWTRELHEVVHRTETLAEGLRS